MGISLSIKLSLIALQSLLEPYRGLIEPLHPLLLESYRVFKKVTGNLLGVFKKSVLEESENELLEIW